MERFFGNAYRGDSGVPHSDPKRFANIWIGAFGFAAITWFNPHIWHTNTQWNGTRSWTKTCETPTSSTGCIGLTCPCYLFGKNAEFLGSGTLAGSCMTHFILCGLVNALCRVLTDGILLGLPGCVVACYACGYRKALRSKYDLPVQPTNKAREIFEFKVLRFNPKLPRDPDSQLTISKFK